MKKILLAAAALCCPTVDAALAQGPLPNRMSYVFEPEAAPRERTVDFERMVLEVRFAPKEKKVEGTVHHHFRALRPKTDSLVLDAVNLKIEDVRSGTKKLRYRYDNTLLVVYTPGLQWDTRDSISIRYTATPKAGLHFTGWNDPSGRARKQIWTQGQAIDHRHWIPLYDDANDKMITETITEADSSLKVLSNGALVSRTPLPNGNVRWHYAMDKPHSSYLLMLGIGHYDIEERRSASGVPLKLWYYPEFPERVVPTYRYSAEAMNFMEELTGIPYPWGTYSQIPVQDFVAGAMENTSSTVFGDFFLCDARGALDRSYVGVNVHELVHQWFGDYITHRSLNHLWLHESFATFYPKLFTRRFEGEDEYQWMRWSEQRSALAAGKKDRLPITNTKAGSSRYYPKGSAVLDMLMHTVGEKAFHRTIHHYLKAHAFDVVESNDLVQAFQDTLGVSLQWFFDQWIYRGGEPRYTVQWESVAKATRLNVRQTHAVDELTGYFSMPVGVEVYYTDGTSDEAMPLIEGPSTSVDIPNPGNREVAFVLFDPGSMVLKELDFRRPVEELRAQALRAPLMIDRYEALVAMAEAQPVDTEKLRTLASIFTADSFHAIRAEVVRQVAGDTSAAAVDILRRAAADRDVRVRKAVVNNLKRVPMALKEPIAKMLSDSSYAVVESALRLLCHSFPQDAQVFLSATASTEGMHRRVAIARCELLAGRGDAAALATLEDYCSVSFEFITRQNAYEALTRLGHCSLPVIESIAEAVTGTNSRLANRAKETAKTLLSTTKNRSLFEVYLNTLAPGSEQYKALKELL